MLFTCAAGCTDPAHRHSRRVVRSAPLAAPKSSRASAVAKPNNAGPVIDVHCHYLSPAVTEKTRDLTPAQHDVSVIYANDLTRQTNIAQMRERAPQLTSVERRLQDMERMGIDMQVVSPAPFHYFYFTEGARGATIARDVNESIAELAAHTSGRFLGLGSVPLQSSKHAVKALDHAVNELGLKGVQINTNVNGQNLTDPRLNLEPFFAKANELQAVIFLHPHGFTQAERLTEHYFNNVIGNPLDTTIAISHLIFDGVLARYPRIKFIAAHGGGYIGSYWARMDHAWRARPDCRGAIKKPPSTFLKKFYVDTMVFDPELLRHLINTFGADRVLLGTDYPYDMGEDDPRGLIASVPDLSEEEVAQIEGLNAAKLLKIRRRPV